MKKAFLDTNAYVMAAMIWAFIVFALLVAPISEQMHNDVLTRAWVDKLVHATLFGVLYYLSIRALGAKTTEARMIIILIAVSAYGILCEGAQFYLEDRSFDILDIIANIMGSLVVYIFIKRN